MSKVFCIEVAFKYYLRKEYSEEEVEKHKITYEEEYGSNTWNLQDNELQKAAWIAELPDHFEIKMDVTPYSAVWKEKRGK